ncbi:MAG: hypothetical protein FWC41_10500 [Firmicutes bacterium]|nr:hypothetical protein [Bacillota bacterium]
MKISSYDNASFVNSNEFRKNNKPDSKKEMTKTSNTVQNPDRLEISDEVKKLNSIREKIDSGFYDNPAVLDTVAKKIMASI